jgi:hypothetical protein
MNLSGTWKYSEDYTYGDSVGELVLEHKGRQLKGTLIHCETPIEGSSFKVKQELKGLFDINDKSFVLKAVSAEVLESEEDILYELDSFAVQVMNEDLIVGTTEDEQGVLGVFSFKRI